MALQMSFDSYSHKHVYTKIQLVEWNYVKQKYNIKIVE